MASPAKIIKQNLPTVTIVGRVNVGKSTLFNKLTERDHALVSTIPGTTRTRNIGTVAWRGKNFRLIDTGGLSFSDDVPLEKDIIQQTEMALKESDLVIFLVDIKTGILPQERELSKRLRKYKDRLMFVANKVDSKKLEDLALEKEFLVLGLGAPFPVSATNGANLGELLDVIIKKLNKLSKRPKKIKSSNPIRVALIGKPNVGKSTLFNALIGKDEVVVSPMAHATREPFDTLVEYGKQPMLFIDTAGIRRKTRVKQGLEAQGIEKSIKSTKKSDVVLLLLDTSEPISSQDKQLGGLLKENTRSVIIIINKWDTADANDDHFRKQVRQLVYGAFPHLDFAPILFISAKTKYRIHQIFPEILKAWQGRNTEITNNALDKFVQKIVKIHKPSRGKGTRYPKILGLKQLNANPPIFELTLKAGTSMHTSYVHFMKNQLREKFNFYATPIVIKLHKRRK
ncbi:MAG: ribosome biogenesis GTPase Der [bacterium]